MVGTLWEVDSPFRATSRKRGGDRTTTLTLPRSQPSLVLLRIQAKTEREFFLQRLRIPSAGSSSSPPGLSRIRASPARHLWYYSIFDFWSRPWSVARLLGLRGITLRPHPSEGVG